MTSIQEPVKTEPGRDQTIQDNLKLNMNLQV